MDVCCCRFVICRCRNSSHRIVCIIEVPLYPIHGPCSKCFPLLGDGVIESTMGCLPLFLFITIMGTASRSILLCWFVDLCMLITRCAV